MSIIDDINAANTVIDLKVVYDNQYQVIKDNIQLLDDKINEREQLSVDIEALRALMPAGYMGINFELVFECRLGFIHKAELQ